MSSIQDVRKFLVRERFVVLKGDYVGHPFRGNQYSDLGSAEHLQEANRAARETDSLKSEGRRRYGRSHGYSLDGDLAKASLDALDHAASAKAKVGVLKTTISELEEKIKRNGGDPKTPIDGFHDSVEVRQLKDNLQRSQEQLSHITSGNMKFRIDWNKSLTSEQMSKQAASALNRGYKEVLNKLSSMPGVTMPKAKSLLDNKNNPRPEALKVLQNDVKQIDSIAKKDAKTAQDESASPEDRYNATVGLRNLSKNALSAHTFLEQVYRISGDTTNQDAEAKIVEKAKASIGKADEHYTNNFAQITLSYAKESIDKASKTIDLSGVNLFSISPEQKQTISDAKSLYSNAYRILSDARLGNTDEARLARDNSQQANALLNTARSNELKATLDGSMKNIGKATADKSAYENTQKAERDYRTFQSAVGEAKSNWNGLSSNYGGASSPELNAKAQSNAIGLANQLELVQKTAGLAIGKEYLKTASDSLKFVRENLGNTDPAVAEKADKLITEASSAANTARGLFSKESRYYSSSAPATSGLENEWNQASRFEKECTAYSNAVRGTSLLEKGLAETRSMPEKVDMSDIGQDDPNSYVSLKAKAAGTLDDSFGYLTRGVEAIDKSDLFSKDEKQELIGKLKDQATQAGKELADINFKFYRDGLDSMVVNGSKELEKSKDTDDDNPMYASTKAEKLLVQATYLADSIENSIAHKELSGSLLVGHFQDKTPLQLNSEQVKQLKETLAKHSVAEIQQKADEAKQGQRAFYRLRQYAL